MPGLIEMFEVMAELEGMCARLAARRITADESERLQELLEKCALAEQTGALRASPPPFLTSVATSTNCRVRAMFSTRSITQD